MDRSHSSITKFFCYIEGRYLCMDRHIEGGSAAAGSTLEAGSLRGEEQARPAVSKQAEVDPSRGGGGTAATAAGERPQGLSCRSDAAGSNREPDREPLQHLSKDAKAEAGAEGAAASGSEAGLQSAVGTADESAQEQRIEGVSQQVAADSSFWDDSPVPGPEQLLQPVSNRQLEGIRGLASGAHQAQHEAVRWSSEVMRLAQQPWHKAQPPPLPASAKLPGTAFSMAG